MGGGSRPVEDFRLSKGRGVFANSARGRGRSGDYASRTADDEATNGGLRVDHVELLRRGAERSAALSARGHLRQDQVGGAMPARRPERVSAGLAEQQELRASGPQLVHVQPGRRAALLEVCLLYTSA